MSTSATTTQITAFVLAEFTEQGIDRDTVDAHIIQTLAVFVAEDLEAFGDSVVDSVRGTVQMFLEGEIEIGS